MRRFVLVVVVLSGCGPKGQSSTQPADSSEDAPRVPDGTAPTNDQPQTATPSSSEPDSVIPSAQPERDPGQRPPNTIYRSEVQQALARGPGYLLSQLGPEPFKVQGRFIGWEITRVFPDEPDLCHPECGLAVGDIILSVNGDRLETPTAFSNMVQRLPELDELQVKSLRDEKRRIVTYRIVDG